MPYPLVPPYAERREFHREFWAMLSVAIRRLASRIRGRSLHLADPIIASKGISPCR